MLVGGRQELLVDGGKGVSLPPSVESGSLPLDMDSLCDAPPEPVSLLGQDGDTVFIY